MQIGIAIAHGTTQNAANDIACAITGGQLSVGNGKGNSADMVGSYAERYIGHRFLSIRFL